MDFLKRQPKCIVEACGSYRGREKLGHEVRLLPLVYVKPFVKRERRGGRGRRSACRLVEVVQGAGDFPRGMIAPRSSVPSGAGLVPPAFGKSRAPGRPYRRGQFGVLRG